MPDYISLRKADELHSGNPLKGTLGLGKPRWNTITQIDLCSISRDNT